MELIVEMTAILKELEKAKLPYALCGGMALSIHGHPRATKDIDIIVRKRDVPKIKQAIAPVGFIVGAIPMTFRAGTPNETRVHRISKFVGEDFMTLDLLEMEPSLKEIWKGRKRIGTTNGTISVVSRSGLIQMKRNAGRLQDLADIEALEKDNEQDLES